MRSALGWLEADALTIAACRRVDFKTPAALREALAGTERLWFDPFGPPVASVAPRLVDGLLARRALFGITEAGVSAIAWRREHGDWPPSLDGIDPFTGGPLGYEKTAEGGVRVFVRAPERLDELCWLLR